MGRQIQAVGITRVGGDAVEMGLPDQGGNRGPARSERAAGGEPRGGHGERGRQEMEEGASGGHGRCLTWMADRRASRGSSETVPDLLPERDRKSVVEGKSGYVRVDLGGGGLMNKNTEKK